VIFCNTFMLFDATLPNVLRQSHIREWNNAITSKAYFRIRNPNAVTLGDHLYFIAELINIQYVIEYL